MKLLTQSEENYIKAIYALSESDGKTVSTNLLADKIATKASSVTDMLKKLTEKNIVTYTKYQGCTLTPNGLKIALGILRKHRLWETFLVDKLNFGWDEVHDIAEQLEHIQSNKLTNKLDEFLGFPKVDPHGDPIPSETGVLSDTKKRVILSTCAIGCEGTVMGVEDGEPEFLVYLNRIGLGLGSQLKIEEKLSFDGSLNVLLDGKNVQFSQIVASRIFIQVK